MFNSEALEVAIGTILVFLVASLAVSAIREIIEGFLKTRAVQLEQEIRIDVSQPATTHRCRSLQTHPGTQMTSGGGHIINVLQITPPT